MKRMPQDFASARLEHERKWEATQRIGNRILGFIWGFGLAYFLWLINKWVEIGGAP